MIKILKKVNNTRLCTNSSKIILSLLMLVLFYFSYTLIVPYLFSTDVDKKLHRKCIYPVVMVESMKGNKSTGVIIRSDKIKNGEYHNVAISTNHGITTRELAVYVPNYFNWSELGKIEMYPGIAYYQHPTIDLSVIFFITNKKMPEAELGFKERIYIGSEIVRVGCGLGSSPRLEKGTITSLNEIVNDRTSKRKYRMGIYTLPGDSGGPVYHNYRIVGWTQSIRQTRSKNSPVGTIHYNFAYAIRLKDLCSIARKENLEFLINKKEPLPKFGFFKLKIDFLNQNNNIIPDNPWIYN